LALGIDWQSVCEIAASENAQSNNSAIIRIFKTPPGVDAWSDDIPPCRFKLMPLIDLGRPRGRPEGVGFNQISGGTVRKLAAESVGFEWLWLFLIGGRLEWYFYLFLAL
jgi:hypothetical protein